MEERVQRYLNLLRDRTTADQAVRARIDTELAVLASNMTPWEIKASWALSPEVNEPSPVGPVDLVVVARDRLVLAMIRQAVPELAVYTTGTIGNSSAPLHGIRPKMLIIDGLSTIGSDLIRLVQAVRAGTRIPVLVVARFASDAIDSHSLGCGVFDADCDNAPLLLGVIVRSSIAAHSVPDWRASAA